MINIVMSILQMKKWKKRFGKMSQGQSKCEWQPQSEVWPPQLSSPCWTMRILLDLTSDHLFGSASYNRAPAPGSLLYLYDLFKLGLFIAPRLMFFHQFKCSPSYSKIVLIFQGLVQNLFRKALPDPLRLSLCAFFSIKIYSQKFLVYFASQLCFHA